MTSQLTVTGVDHHEDHYDVRFRETDEFEQLETPDWASDLAGAEVPGSEVRMGQDDTDEWLVQRVRIPVARVDDEADAARKALQVVTVVSEHETPDSQ